MKTSKKPYLNILLSLMLFSIIAPILILVLWAFVSKWPWPHLLPQEYSLRAVKELLMPHNQILSTLLSSMALSLTVGFLSALVALMTARALVYYDFWGKSFIESLSMAPLLVPASVFAMGIHIVFLRASLNDSLLGVLIVHLIYTLPYSVSLLLDMTQALGPEMEMQAYVLGASPFKAFTKISLPLLGPAIITSISMAYISSFSQYFLTLLIGGGRVKTFSNIMVPFIAKGDRSIGSAYGLVFILSTLVLLFLLDRGLKKLLGIRRGGNSWN